MSPKNLVLALMKQLVIADKRAVSDYLFHLGLYSSPHSAYVNAGKALDSLAKSGKLIKGKTFYKLPGCKSNYHYHAKALTEVLIQFKKLPYQTVIFREVFIEPLKLRPDSVILIIRGDNMARCVILEVCRNETMKYLESKLKSWFGWADACDYLSCKLRVKIPWFDFVATAAHPKVITLDDFLKEVMR